MSEHVVVLSIPGLRQRDLAHMPRLQAFTSAGDCAELSASFPAVTCCVQTNLATGVPPTRHGVVANGFYWRDRDEIEMWTAWNEVIEAPQIWDLLAEKRPELSSAVWFPMLSKGCGAKYVCTPAPIHNPDGSESLWCYTKPTELYGELRDALGHFPLQHFWGPLANIKSSAWIADSAIHAAKSYRPNFFFIYLTHLDYAAQKHGPNSDAATAALGELDSVLGRLFGELNAALTGGDRAPTWLIASEYAITPVEHVVYPNRVLREAGFVRIKPDAAGRELLDTAGSDAWALVDHQFSHVYVKDAANVAKVADLFRKHEGIDEVLVGDDLDRYDLRHERSGEIVLVSRPDSWQAYYYWTDDASAPGFARTVDIHRKPGYDPVELHFDPAIKSIPLDATLIGGSHGAPVREPHQRGVLLTSEPGVLPGPPLVDVNVADLVLRQFGV